ncbi:uncharacterized protein J4E78_009564 [Alternaria triticimaculans]|uniref:uncharacterized protein n=1 Tax=Alternaria triticimaculans TaxID=297637 RepID=UPI0020C2D2D8|nr:uncharacterized protein J4E78_009564 [Alternaria triticimaculans]KAI4644745.1 hypothetical protein J4E78_009564 [Alternaria triticimaculans]
MGAWGYCLFQSDHDFEIVEALDTEAGLFPLMEAAQARARAQGKSEEEAGRCCAYSTYAPYCSHPKLIRNHLDSGILVDMIATKEAKMLAGPVGLKEKWFGNWGPDPTYVYVLLGACAMTLGCKLPAAYITMLKKVYTEGGLMPAAQGQMKKALFGPNGYKNGVPYDFKSKSITEEANARPSEPANGMGFQMMNVPGPGGLFSTGMTDSSTSLVVKELREQFNKPDLCGGCGVKARAGGDALLSCAKCKNRKYCSTECQKKHWKVHKKVCELADVPL